MPIRIKLARMGSKNRPFYRVIAGSNKGKRDTAHEVLGQYDPVPDRLGNKQLRLNTDRVKYWIGVGCRISPAAQGLLTKFDLIPHYPKYHDFHLNPDKHKDMPDWWKMDVWHESHRFKRLVSQYGMDSEQVAERKAGWKEKGIDMSTDV